MRFVLDASVAITWALRDENHPLADMAFEELGLGSAVVPAIWWFELRNVLILSERRGRISPSDCTQFLKGLESFKIEVAPLGHGAEIMDLSRRYGLSVYDAAYLDLASRELLPLSTLDKALQTAAQAAGIALLT